MGWRFSEGCASTPLGAARPSRESAALPRIRAAIKRALVVVESDAMQAVLEDIAHAVGCDAPAVVEGERGTGREMIARLIHHAARQSRA